MYKVKCTLLEFEFDETEHPCHFNYKIGDEILFDGEKFTGRICPNLMPSLMPVLLNTYNLGYKATEYIAYRYRGKDTRDESMFKYDGLGFRPVITPAPAADAPIDPTKKSPKTGRARTAYVVCGDTRTLARFAIEPYDLADCMYAQPFYRREIAILEKVEAEPGIQKSEIINRFTDWEVNGISPRLTPVLFEVLIEALEDMGYIVVADDGSVTATGKEPPSRPVIPAKED